MSENGEIYTAGKKFSLPPALTAWTNSTSGTDVPIPDTMWHILKKFVSNENHDHVSTVTLVEIIMALDTEIVWMPHVPILDAIWHILIERFGKNDDVSTFLLN